ncbi:uncharacterized protein VTP21DRAFT_7400 [Calcarisporiella thermophila]|uniref:uncharacterized protein n=1 Tax=Calcarisporiella thermophila TaxID=911321 RepID=UPI003742746B
MTHCPSRSFALFFAPLLLLATVASCFNVNCNSNLVNYWGQNSYGAANPGDKPGWQKPLEEYCKDTSLDLITVAFLHVFNAGTGRLPEIDLSNQCSDYFNGTSLHHCPETGKGIKACQAKGKAVLLSLGGAAGSYGFANDNQGREFANTIWNLFLGGKSNTRPFDDAVLDGIDLDIEGGSSVGYTAFVNELRRLFAQDASRKYYIAGAPQCPYPDGYMGPVLDSAWFDMVYVQFYNNYCSLKGSFNYAEWDNWAKTKAVNKNVKLYIGVPASTTAAGSGYVRLSDLQNTVNSVRSKYASFGGVMMWDASQSYNNKDGSPNYAAATSQFLKQGGSCSKATTPLDTLDSPGSSTDSLKAPGPLNPTKDHSGPESYPLPKTQIEFVHLGSTGAKTRLLARVRSKDYPIRANWHLQFSVGAGAKVESVSRGTFEQQGTQVVVKSIPAKEPKYQMALWFEIVIQEAKGLKPNATPDVSAAKFDTSG